MHGFNFHVHENMDFFVVFFVALKSCWLLTYLLNRIPALKLFCLVQFYRCLLL